MSGRVMRKHLIHGDEKGAGLFGEVSFLGKPGTANQFQRRELVAVPALRRAHRSAFSRESPGFAACRHPPPPKRLGTRWRGDLGGCIIAVEAFRMTFIRLLITSALLGEATQ